MSRKFLITLIISVLLIVLVVGFWFFSLINGSSDDERFADFPWWGNGNNEFPTDPWPEQPGEPLLNVSGPALRQLTFRPVIGYGEIIKNEVPTMRYVEAGTGHIYDINLETGQEERVSNITIVNAHEALVSQNGEFSVVRAGYTASSDIVLLNLTSSEPASRTLPYQMNDMALSDNDTVFFTTRSTGGLEAREFDVSLNTLTTLFTVPFLSATIQWERSGIHPHLIYTKPASELIGYTYEVSEDGKLLRLPIVGQGLTALYTGNFVLYSLLEGTNYNSRIFDNASKESTESPITIIPEKCTVSKTSPDFVFCGFTFTTYGYEMPDEWYKGIRTFSDSLWGLDLSTQIAIQFVTPQDIVGRELDITNLQESNDGRMLYFTNKTDKTLWVYEIEF